MATEEKFKVTLRFIDRDPETIINVINFDLDFGNFLLFACSSGSTYFYNSEFVRSVDVNPDT